MSVATPDPVLRLENVSRNFGGVPAVSGLSLDVPRGRITGLIGPNGAGKTTVVNLVMGLLHLSGGRVLLDGRDLSRLEAPALARAGLARTFQNIRLVAEASVLDNVLSGCILRARTGLWSNMFGLPAAQAEDAANRAEALRLLDRFDMRALAGHRAGTLSYGHQRRIEMMRALAMKPQVLLLDEPVAGMNDSEAAELGEIFTEAAKDGVTLLLIEHNMRFVSSVCSYLYVLASGCLIARGRPDDVLRDPGVIEAYLGAE